MNLTHQMIIVSVLVVGVVGVCAGVEVHPAWNTRMDFLFVTFIPLLLFFFSLALVLRSLYFVVVIW